MMKHTLIACAAVVASHQHTLASDWIGGIGDWANPDNWSGNQLPGLIETVIISNNGTAVINGIDFTVGAGLFGQSAIGDGTDGGLAMYGGSLRFEDFGIALFGRDQGTTGSLTLSDGASLYTQTSLELGWMGNANAVIDGGSTVETELLRIGGRRDEPGRTFTSVATVDIAGHGTIVSTTNSIDQDGLVIGAGGSANVTVREGALVDVTNGLLLSTTAAGSSLTIDGQDSIVRVDGTYFDTGRDVSLPNDHPEVGDARLTLRDGGTLDFSQTSRNAIFASHTRIEGTGTIMGNASLFEGAVIDAGENQTYGHIEFIGQLDNSIAGGTLHFDIGSTQDFDRLSFSELIAGGTLEVSIAEDFVAAFGQSFDIITADMLTGDFDLVELPELQGSLYFEANIHAQGVTISVVPAPSSALTLGMSLIILGRRRV